LNLENFKKEVNIIKEIPALYSGSCQHSRMLVAGRFIARYRIVSSTQVSSTRLVHHAVGSTPAILSQADSSQHCIKK